MPSRYICNVFEEMRECLKTNNFSYLRGLIEEAQTMANRMEASIGDSYKVEGLRREIKDLKNKRNKLREEVGDA
jgi:hypothetical protein